jgi:drug/metabolite transporter (DMT)-like permease
MIAPTQSPKIRERLLGYALLASGMGLVGTYVAFSRPLTEVFPVFLLAWLRFGIAAVAMLAWLARPTDEAPPSRTTWRALFVLSFFGNFLFSILMLNGVALAGASSAGVVLAAMPALVGLMSWGFLGERPSARIWLAIAFAITGMLALATAPAPVQAAAGPTSGPALATGQLLLLGCAACEALYVVLGKRLTGSMSPKRISALINLIGCALMTPFGLWQAQSFDFSAVRAADWGLLIFYSLAASMIATWLWLTGLRHVPASHSGVFALALPVAASLVGVGLLGEPFSVTLVFALMCACAGIALVAWPGRDPARTN